MLKPRKRITRKEIKQDKLVTFYFKINDWIGENTKIVYGGLIAIIVVVAATFFISSQQRSSEETASADFAKAERMFENGNYRDAIDLLNVIVDNYGGTKSGRVGKFFLATAHYNLGEYVLAEENFRKYLLKGVNDPLLSSSAMNGIAACLEQRGEYLTAADQYMKAAKKYSKEIFASSALLDASRCYNQSGEKDTAAEVLKKLLAEYPKSEVVEKAKIQLAFLQQSNSTVSVIDIEP